MNRKRPNTSVVPSTSIKKVQLSNKDADKIIESWMDESDESSADENDCLQSDRCDVSEDDEIEDEVSSALQPVDDDWSSDDDAPLSSLVRHTHSEEMTSSVQERQSPIDAVANNDAVVNNNTSREKYYYGKRRCMKWSAKGPSRNARTPAHNIVTPLPVVEYPRNSSPSQLFGLLISESIKSQILLFTNQRFELLREKYKRHGKPELKDLDTVELDAFIGLLIYSAAFKSNDEDINSLFSTDGTGRDIFRGVMSKERFAMILICLRFDDAFTREERKQSDVAAAISDVFEEFIKNCQKYYNIGENTTIDEMLVSFRGRCRWKKYMPNKPCKYGLEIKCLTDGTTSYLYNAYLYTGKDSDGKGLTDEEKKLLVPTQCVLRLAKPIMNTNRNITADNYFSSIEVCNELKKKGLTYVGTLKKNKREIPPEFLDKSRPAPSTMYGFTKELTLLSYVPKKKKIVMLVSSMHHVESTDSDKDLPEIISFYNSSKGGVDSMDEKCTKYSCARRSRRWPLVIFYRILDIAAANSFILSKYPSSDRLKFMKNLAKSLVTPHLQRRHAIQQLSHELKSVIGRILGKDSAADMEGPMPEIEKFESLKNCHICFKQKRRRTRYACQACARPVCLQCSKPTCNNCR